MTGVQTCALPISGDVAFWDPSSSVATLTEEPDFDAGDLVLWLVRDDGTLQGPISVTPGPTSFDVTLAEAPDFDLVLDDGGRERPKYILGTSDNAREVVRVTSIGDGGITEATDTDPGGAQLFALSGVNDDERIHTADNALLPSPGEDQDPLGLPDDSDETGGGEILLTPRLLARTVQALAVVSDTLDLEASITLRNVGTAFVTIEASGSSSSAELSGEWLLYGAAEPAQCGLFEVRATVVTSSTDGPNVTLTGTLDTWLPLDTERAWILTGTYNGTDTKQAVRLLRLEIRETSTLLVQTSALVSLELAESIGGGA